MPSHTNKKNLHEQSNMQHDSFGRLLIKCTDKPGIVAMLSKFLFDHGANIIESSQYSSDPEGGDFFIRLEFHCDHLNTKRQQMENDFDHLANQFNMDFQFTYGNERKRTAIFVSKETHCLMELLWEWQSGDLKTDIAVVISNHENAREYVEALGIPFHYIPANKTIRQEVEKKQIALMKEYQIDLLILAPQLQNLPPNFVAMFLRH